MWQYSGRQDQDSVSMLFFTPWKTLPTEAVVYPASRKAWGRVTMSGSFFRSRVSSFSTPVWSG